MMANLADLGLYSGLPGTLGPRVVVLCSGQAEVSDLGQIISVLVAHLNLQALATRAGSPEDINVPRAGSPGDIKVPRAGSPSR